MSSRRLNALDLVICVLCGLSIFTTFLAAMGDITGNTGIWTLGGPIGPSRWAIYWNGQNSLIVLFLLWRVLRNGNGKTSSPSPGDSGMRQVVIERVKE